MGKKYDVRIGLSKLSIHAKPTNSRSSSYASGLLGSFIDFNCVQWLHISRRFLILLSINVVLFFYFLRKDV